MGQRGTQDWSKARLKLGTVRIRKHSKRCSVRMVKIRDDGPKGRRWITLARHWWLENRGPIPDGMRVVHGDGDVLNDDPDNYVLATADDVLMLSRDWDPTLDARNRRACRKGCSRHNRERARVLRCQRLWPNLWYPVDVDTGRVENVTSRERWELLRHMGHAVDAMPNGGGWLSIVLGWPDASDCGACLLHALDTPRPDSFAHWTGPELLAMVNELRQRYGASPVSISTIRSELCRLRRKGNAYTIERGVWRITGRGQVRRVAGDRRCPMTGAAILARWGEMRYFPPANAWLSCEVCLPRSAARKLYGRRETKTAKREVLCR